VISECGEVPHKEETYF